MFDRVLGSLESRVFLVQEEAARKPGLPGITRSPAASFSGAISVAVDVARPAVWLHQRVDRVRVDGHQY